MAAGDITTIADLHDGQRNIVYGTVEIPATYVAGGIALAKLDGGAVGSGAKFGLNVVDFVSFETVELAATTALIARYDRATDKVMLHEGDGPTTAGPLAETNEDTTALTEVRFKAEGRK